VIKRTVLQSFLIYALMEFIPPPTGDDNVVWQKLKILKNSCLNPIAIGIGSSQNEQGIGLQAAQWETTV